MGPNFRVLNGSVRVYFGSTQTWPIAISTLNSRQSANLFRRTNRHPHPELQPKSQPFGCLKSGDLATLTLLSFGSQRNQSTQISSTELVEVCYR